MGLIKTAIVAGVAYKAGQGNNNKNNTYQGVPAHACNCPYCHGSARMQPAWHQQAQYQAPAYGAAPGSRAVYDEKPPYDKSLYETASVVYNDKSLYPQKR